MEATTATDKQSNLHNKTKETHSIVSFITAISNKNYAQANKYLKLVVNEKIKNRINKAASKPLF